MGSSIEFRGISRVSGNPAASGDEAPHAGMLGTSRTGGGNATPVPRPRPAHIVAAAALAALAGCHSFVEGNGVYFEEDRTGGLAAFVGLRVEDGIQGKLAVGSPARVVVSGDSNIVKSISTAVVGLGDGSTSVLQVKVDLDNFTPRLPLSVTVTVPEVRYLSASGASRIEASGASTAPGIALQAVASDGSNLTLAGPGGESLEVVLSGGPHGGATLDARGYPVPALGAVTVALTGSSHALVTSAGPVSGTAEQGSIVEVWGGGACNVTLPGSATANCTSR